MWKPPALSLTVCNRPPPRARVAASRTAGTTSPPPSTPPRPRWTKACQGRTPEHDVQPRDRWGQQVRACVALVVRRDPNRWLWFVGLHIDPRPRVLRQPDYLSTPGRLRASIHTSPTASRSCLSTNYGCTSRPRPRNEPPPRASTLTHAATPELFQVRLSTALDAGAPLRDTQVLARHAHRRLPYTMTEPAVISTATSPTPHRLCRRRINLSATMVRPVALPRRCQP